MTAEIYDKCYNTYNSLSPDLLLNRSWNGMYFEWYLHNIGYFLTLPFVKNEFISKLNERFKHVDLEEHIKIENKEV